MKTIKNFKFGLFAGDTKEFCESFTSFAKAEKAAKDFLLENLSSKISFIIGTCDDDDLLITSISKMTFKENKISEEAI